MAQIPSHFILGEETFANTDIYDIGETPNGDIYVATNDGLYRYTQNQFIKLAKCDGQLGTSFFDLKLDRKGNLYCKNLKNQIFSIDNNTVKLHYTIRSLWGLRDFNYFFTNENRLMISGENIYIVNEDKSKEIIVPTKYQKNGKLPFFEKPTIVNDSIFFFVSSAEEDSAFYLWENGQMKSVKRRWQSSNKRITGDAHPKYLRFGENTIIISDNNVKINLEGNAKINFNPFPFERFFPLKNGIYIGINGTKGIRIIKESNASINAGEVLFPNQFISCVHENKKGTLLLGTFGGGILVVPNLNAIKYEKNVLFRGIAAGKEDECYITTREGKVFFYKDSLMQLGNYGVNQDYVFYFKKEITLRKQQRNLLFDAAPGLGLPRIKDAFETEEGVWIATNGGYGLIKREGFSTPSFLSENKRGPKEYYNTNQELRYTSIAFDFKTKLLYVANANGVQTISKTGKINTLFWKEEKLVCNDIYIYNDKVYFATQENGILTIENNTLVSLFDISNGLRDSNVKRIEIKHKTLYTLTNKGLQGFNLDTHKLIYFDLSAGIQNKLISNFTISDKKLFILENDAFYALNLKDIKNSIVIPKLIIDSLLIGNVNQRDNKTVRFSHTENELSAFLDYKNIETKDEIILNYMLEGFDTEWQQTFGLTNVLKYPSLPPNNYNLKIYLSLKGKNSAIFTKPFKILKPFWQRWWFYLFIVLFIGSITALFFKRKLKLQAKEARRENELNISKLTAIQSQMNPHFVFNALNSIQHLVIKKDTDNAYNYITRFANLVRRTLDYSEKETISLLQEIELLEVYLQLEKLRFGPELEYAFNKKEIRDVQVPPMLIQPFIENALIHGLMHKEGLKKLTITLHLVGNTLNVSVEDNGIGREKAKIIRQRQRGDHKSFAINAIDNRFRILREIFKQEIGYHYQDIMEETVVTRVILKIPTS